LQKFDEAKLNIERSIKSARDYLGENHFEYAFSLLELAMIEIAMNDFSSAIRTMEKVEVAYSKVFPPTDEEYINILRIKAFVLSRLHQFAQSEAVFNKADSLLSININYNKDDLQGVPRYLSFRNANLLMDKARMYQEWFGKSGDIDKLAASVELYNQSLGIYEQFSQFATEESRLLLGENVRDTYEDAVRAAWDLYKLNGDSTNIDYAFGFAGKAKASVLLSAVRKLKAFEAAGVPAQTTEAERRFRLEIHALTRATSEERLKPQPNPKRIAFLDAKRTILSRSYDSLLQHIEINYPDYYALRYAPATLTTKQVQQNLENDQVLVEYFIENNQLYIFAIRADSMLVMRNLLKPGLEADVESFRNIMLGNLMYHGPQQYNAFIGLSTKLYSELIMPLEGFIDGRRLVIVPDGVLGYLPFDLLIKPSKLNEEHYAHLNYAQLPFLLYDHPLSYLSSSALTSAFRSASGQKSGKMLAMAPEYDEVQPGRHNQLSPLPYALKEAEMVRNIWGGVLLAGSKATKKAFIETAPKFGLIHLAMHTLLDDENPLYSRLIFQAQDTGTSFIYGYELYALRFKAAMVVLSACNSGFGELRSAEGVMSLSRAFMYAGAPAVVMTGWEVNDQSGARLMELFYRHLADGLTKDKALQQAKIDWLGESNQLKSHPFYWAAYQMLGDTQPLKKSYTPYLLLMVAMVLLTSFVVFITVRRRRIITFAAKA
ncbi:MAG TPA: CHAT domain-containing protein, partial [Bacteroidales bacterium]|nr:CHAT domain-containing protein [Bacteroidales bacterium]